MACECGCGEAITPGRRYISGHNRRMSPVAYVVDDNGCWIWQRTRNAKGYGVVGHTGKIRAAHRVYYAAAKGPIPEGLHIDHLCRVPPCVNPDHMEAVTNTENVRRGRSAKLTAENVVDIRQRLATGATGISLAAEYGVTPQAISLIKTRTNWAA